MDLKAVTMTQSRAVVVPPRGRDHDRGRGVFGIEDDRVEISEAMLVDQQADFDPRTVDLSGVEEAAVRAEAGGHKDYARQIWRLVRRWQQAAAK